MLPQFKSPFGFLRARACWVFGEYSQITYKNIENIKDAVNGIHLCLSDSDLVVRAEAAISLNSLLSQQYADIYVRPIFPKILEILVELIQEIIDQGIVESLEGILIRFKDELGPYAQRVVQVLCRVFHKCISQENERSSKSS